MFAGFGMVCATIQKQMITQQTTGAKTMDSSIKPLRIEHNKQEPSADLSDNEYDNIVRVYNSAPLTISLQMHTHCRPRSDQTFKTGKKSRARSVASLTIADAKELISMLQNAISDTGFNQ